MGRERHSGQSVPEYPRDRQYPPSSSLSTFVSYSPPSRADTQRRQPPVNIDDVACMVVGNTEEENCIELEAIAKTAFEWGDNNAVAFDDPKTELIHFHRRRQSPECPVTLPNGTVTQPSPVVRWLGVFFDRKLSFRTHINRKVTFASRALQMISRLNTSERGLSPQHLHQLYTSCVTPILDYRAEAWWRGQKGYFDKLQKLQNAACRKILGVFRTSPIVPMELEASLPHQRFDYNIPAESMP